jgi:hypothetical protein
MVTTERTWTITLVARDSGHTVTALGGPCCRRSVHVGVLA